MRLIEFQRQDRRGTALYDALFLGCFAAVLLAIALPFASGQPGVPYAAAALAMAGICGLVWVFRHSPQLKYYRAAWLEHDGLHWRDEPDGIARFLPWSAIKSMDPSYTVEVEGSPGIRVTTFGQGDSPAEVWISLDIGRHADEMIAAVADALAEKAR